MYTKEFSSNYTVNLESLKKNMENLEDWDDDFYLLDKLDVIKRVYSKAIYAIDRFPKIIELDNKYPQLEIFYTPEIDRDSNHPFFLEESKFLSVLSKLWAYSSCYLESTIYYDEALPDDIFQNTLYQEIKTKFKDQIVPASSWEEMQYLLKLSLKDYIYTCIYLPELRLIIWVKGLHCMVYTDDEKIDDWIKTVCQVEGLYLRKTFL